MKVKYTMNHFKVTLPIWVVSFLLGACSKLGERYGNAPMPVPMEVDEGCSSGSEIYSSRLDPWTENLFKAIRKNDINTVSDLLSGLDVNLVNDWQDKITSFAPENMCTCLHIAAGIKDPQAIEIMKRLLDKMGPWLLSKKDYANLLHEKNRLAAFKKEHIFWEENRIQVSPNHLEQQAYNNSPLLWKNDREETALLIAAKEGSLGVFKLLLDYTHRYSGLNLAEHIDEEGNDLLDIVLQQPDDSKLFHLMCEVQRCNYRSKDRSWIHFSATTKCKSESVIRAIGNPKQKLIYLFKAVHNNKLKRLTLFLDTIVTVLGPVDCLKIFTKECPDQPSGYTILHTALDKNLLGEEDMDTVKVLTFFLLATLKFILPKCPDSSKNKLELLLSIDKTNHLKKDIKSILTLLKEHKCDAALADFYTALRIMILIDSETPPAQYWSFSPLDPSNPINYS